MDRHNRLVEERQKLWDRMQEIQRSAEAEDRDWTAEERTNWDKANTRLDEVCGDIERLERNARLAATDYTAVEAPAEERVEPVEDRAGQYAEAFGAYIRHGMSGLDQAQQRMLQANYSSPEERAQGAGVDAAGGYLVPEEFRNMMTEAIEQFGGILNLANVITTSSGGPLTWPSNDDTGNVGAILGENTQIGEQDLTFGQTQIGAYTYTSKLVRVSWQLLQDSAFQLEPYLARKLGERIGRAAAAHFVSGTGTGQPEGLVAGATAGVTGAVSATPAITYDNLVDLEHSIDPGYRENARYVLSDGALKILRKLKDADGRPIWQPVPAAGFPSTINGFPYTIDNSMAAPAAEEASILFGDIRAGYLVRRVLGIQLVTLKERYADFLQNGFFAYSRLDAMVDNAAAVRTFVHGAAA
jgi:HK97 family phage major capsid protein